MYMLHVNMAELEVNPSDPALYAQRLARARRLSSEMKYKDALNLLHGEVLCPIINVFLENHDECAGELLDMFHGSILSLHRT